MNTFTEYHPSLESYFRSIILFGKNAASYKFAMAKSLFELSQNQTHTFIPLDEVSVPFAHHICEHLKLNDKQTTSISSKYLNVCRDYNAGRVGYDELIDTTTKLAFYNVLDAFHHVNQGTLPVSFFDVQKVGRSKGIILTDNLYHILESTQSANFEQEIEARWRLVETAWSLNMPSSLLQVKHDQALEEFYITETNQHRRIAITSARSALCGYQKGTCFYCYRDISIQPGDAALADVDHFLPHKLGTQIHDNLNGVWNLVLACQPCNRGPKGSLHAFRILSIYINCINEMRPSLKVIIHLKKH